MHKHWTLDELSDDLCNGLTYLACKDLLFWCLPPLMCSLSSGRKAGMVGSINPLINF